MLGLRTGASSAIVALAILGWALLKDVGKLLIDSSDGTKEPEDILKTMKLRSKGMVTSQLHPPGEGRSKHNFAPLPVALEKNAGLTCSDHELKNLITQNTACFITCNYLTSTHKLRKAKIHSVTDVWVEHTTFSGT